MRLRGELLWRDREFLGLSLEMDMGLRQVIEQGVDVMVSENEAPPLRVARWCDYFADAYLLAPASSRTLRVAAIRLPRDSRTSSQPRVLSPQSGLTQS
jgi:hypothetical protein